MRRLVLAHHEIPNPHSKIQTSESLRRNRNETWLWRVKKPSKRCADSHPKSSNESDSGPQGVPVAAPSLPKEMHHVCLALVSGTKKTIAPVLEFTICFKHKQKHARTNNNKTASQHVPRNVGKENRATNSQQCNNPRPRNRWRVRNLDIIVIVVIITTNIIIITRIMLTLMISAAPGVASKISESGFIHAGASLHENAEGLGDVRLPSDAELWLNDRPLLRAA